MISSYVKHLFNVAPYSLNRRDHDNTTFRKLLQNTTLGVEQNSFN